MHTPAVTLPHAGQLSVCCFSQGQIQPRLVVRSCIATIRITIRPSAVMEGGHCLSEAEKQQLSLPPILSL